MSGEISKKYNPYYDDYDRMIKNKIERVKFLEGMNEAGKKPNNERQIPVNINGTVYKSINSAALALGCSVRTLAKYNDKLNKSLLSELEATVMTKRTFTFKKIKD